MIYQTEKSLNDYGDKISQEDKDNIKKSADELKSILNTDNVSEIKAKIEELQKVSYKLAEEMYKSSQASGQNPNAGEGGEQSDSSGSSYGSSGSKVEDADYEVVDDEENKQ